MKTYCRKPSYEAREFQLSSAQFENVHNSIRACLLFTVYRVYDGKCLLLAHTLCVVFLVRDDLDVSESGDLVWKIDSLGTWSLAARAVSCAALPIDPTQPDTA